MNFPASPQLAQLTVHCSFTAEIKLTDIPLFLNSADFPTASNYM